MREKASMAEFRELYNRQITRVYKLALVLLGSVADAEDVAQTVFLKVWVIILVYLVQASCNIRTSVPVLFGR